LNDRRRIAAIQRADLVAVMALVGLPRAEFVLVPDAPSS